MKLTSIMLALLTLTIAPLRADVTIMSTLSTKGGMAGALVGDKGLEATTYIKGTKMRSETGQHVTIMDAATRQMIALDPKKKEAVIYSLEKMQADIEKVIAARPVARVTPNGRTKTLLGQPCAGYDLTITVPMKMGNEAIDMAMVGPLWIAKGVPGTGDYIGFYKAAAENGLFFGNPDAARGQGGAQMQSTVEMYRQIASLGGIAYETEMQMKFQGGGTLGAMMDKAGGMTMTTTVTSVSTEPIGADKFTVPADYKTKTR